MSWFSRCSWCGDPFNDANCSYCGGLFNNGNCPSCSIVGAGNEFVHNPNPLPYDNTPYFYDQPPQYHVETYSCELCGNDSHYGYDCPPRFPLVYEQEPCYNQNFGDNFYQQNSLSFPQQYLCCENYGGFHESFQCQPRNKNYFEPNPFYDSNSSGFDQPSQYSNDNQEDLNQQRMNDVDDRSNKMIESGNKIILFLGEIILQQKYVANLKDTIPLHDIISQLPPSIVITTSPSVLPIEDPEDSLIIGNEELSIILEKEMDKDIESNDFYDSNLDEPALLVTPIFDSNEHECFDLGGDVDEINSFDILSDFEDGYYDSQGDVLYLESFLSDDTTPNLPPEVTDIHKRTENKAKRAKPSTRLEVREKSKPKAYATGYAGVIQGLKEMDLEVVRDQGSGLDAWDTPKDLEASSPTINKEGNHTLGRYLV
uniref:Pre-mRNA splicing Prp18-interacting factor n=1 Tax=Tanacetum cinerariifolium TaxID=118510 RepID=A0A699HUC2_TANCI|nr:hypothetical protein [Tanacetum cinerariifolium]